MEHLQIEKYTLSYRPTRKGDVSFVLEANLEDKALKHPHRLLYIVTFQDQFLYVGEAKAELKTRLERGFVSYRHYHRTGKARGGYKGYKWIEFLDPKEGEPKKLEVWAALFPSFYDDKRKLIEAIEGETVWEIRRRTQRWPAYQNEIHFNNDLPEANLIANKILEEIK